MNWKLGLAVCLAAVAFIAAPAQQPSDQFPYEADAGTDVYQQSSKVYFSELWRNPYVTAEQRALMIKAIDAHKSGNQIEWGDARRDYYLALKVREAQREIAARPHPAPQTELPRDSTRKYVPRRGDRCWVDYCPCEEGDVMSKGICRDLRGGVSVSNEMMSAGAHMRDAQKALAEWREDHPE